MKIRNFWESVWLIISYPFRPIYRAECGHLTKRNGWCVSHGERYIMKMPFLNNGNLEYCLDCVGKMAIRCIRCGNPIMIGSPVSLCKPIKESFKIPDYAVKYKDDPNFFIGCLGWSCSGGGPLNRAGIWIPPGKVMRMPSPLEMVMSGGGKALFVSDLSDPNDHGTYF